MNTIHALFEKQAQLTPYNTAILWGNDSMSYEELNIKANQLAHFLLSMKIKPNAPIAFCMERSFDCLITILAILKAGAAYLPLDPAYPKERLLFLLNNSETSLVITQHVLKDLFESYQGTVLFLDNSQRELKKQRLTNPFLEVSPNQLAYVIYTSGSTGKPKGVLIEHHSVTYYSQWFAEYAAISTKQRIDFSSNHTFDMTVSTSIVPLMLGLTVVICDKDTKKNLRVYLQYLKNTKTNIIKSTPTFFKALIHEIKNKFIALPHLKTIILGGEALSTIECKAWLESYPKHTLYNEYGPTEATVAVSQYKICEDTLDELKPNIPIGTLAPHIKSLILDANQHPVAVEEVGELYLSGPCLARGYLNRPEITSKQFLRLSVNGEKDTLFYKTGDLCSLTQDGLLIYLGRMDAQVKIRGFRIEPAEIENHLSTHPAIESALVLAKKDFFNENRLLAYYILKSEYSEPTSSELRHFLQQNVPDYMIPAAFIAVTSFPLTPNGKLDSAKLPEPRLNNNQPYRAPVTKLEKNLTAIWSKELGIETIGLNDNFYELGGHSLSAARIVSKINLTMDINLDLKDFYYAETIAQLSIFIKQTKKTKRIQLKRKHQSPESMVHFPLSDFQFLLWIADAFESKAKKINITARKRLQGSLDIRILELAFDALFKKQDILFYRILKLKPAQLVQNYQGFKITEIDLTHLPIEHSEIILKHSMDKLISYYPWPKKSPLILAKLFHLKDNQLELQISIPHIISDDFSSTILFSNLSEFYLLFKQQLKIPVEKHPISYKEYVFNEQQHIQKYIDRDSFFWDNYMKDASLLIFPEDQVVKNMKRSRLSFSTYTAVPESLLNSFKHFCAQSHMSINEGLCAAIALALCHSTVRDEQQTPYIYMNIIKSTRHAEIYDDLIGCFLRLEPVKIALSSQATLTTLAQQIHHSSMETSAYQLCPNLIKLSSISTFRQKRKLIKNFLLNVFTSFYATLFSLPKVNKKIFKLCGERISSFKLTNHFLVNINVQKSFISAQEDQDLNLFGLNTKKIESYQYDLLQINNVLDLCFIRDENDNLPYLVLSANLRSQYRDDIAQKVLHIMETACHFEENVVI